MSLLKTPSVDHWHQGMLEGLPLERLTPTLHDNVKGFMTGWTPLGWPLPCQIKKHVQPDDVMEMSSRLTGAVILLLYAEVVPFLNVGFALFLRPFISCLSSSLALYS